MRFRMRIWGLVYTARLKLDREQIQADERMVKLSPGMSVTAEVAKHLFSMVGYILANSPIFKEGNTIGIEADKNFKMNYAPAKPGLPARWVMKLEAVCAAS